MPASHPSARTAFVVEDDADIGKLLQWVLERERFAVQLIADGRTALERIAASGDPPGLVILDVMLPHASHIFFTDQFAASCDALLSFLDAPAPSD